MAKGMDKLPEEWQAFFKDHLDRVYYITSHLTERLPELAEDAEFAGLRDVISRSIAEAQEQVTRLDAIYHYLWFIPGFEQCAALVQLIEGAFTPIRSDDASRELRELNLIFYLQSL